jgi:ketosteroid isomerase-like protein
MSPTRTGFLAAILISALGACQPADQSTTAAAEVRAADSAWAQAFLRKDLNGYMSFVDSTASTQQPNGPTATGAAAIRELIQGFFSMPGLSGTWQPVTAVASRSGDLAYSAGTYELSWNDPSGNRVTERGKYLEVWRRQADGSWKMIVESFNSDAPPAGAAPQ